MSRVEATAPEGVPEVRAGDDLAALLLRVANVADGDIVALTSKVVSKAEGRVRAGTREDALPDETARVVARRGPLSIVRTRSGLTLAAAGIDASNVDRGTVVLLPEDPDASAARLRTALWERTGHNVGVVVTDTAGRAWREGQTDIAIGAAGLVVAEDHAGRVDRHGNELAVTLPAVADEIAGMAELAQGKLTGRPFAVVRGRADLLLPPGDHGPGARALVRPEGSDLFGYGAREAVVRALRADAADRVPFGAPAAAEEVAAAVLEALGLGAAREGDEGSLAVTCPDDLLRPLRALAFAHGWELLPTDSRGDARLRPARP